MHILNLCLIYFKIIWALAVLCEHMYKKFEINLTKIKGSCQLGRKVVNSKRVLPLVFSVELLFHKLLTKWKACKIIFLVRAVDFLKVGKKYIKHPWFPVYWYTLNDLDFLVRIRQLLGKVLFFFDRIET